MTRTWGKTDLADADLARADLAGANLERAILSRTDLFNADLLGTRLAGLVFSDIFQQELQLDLREALGDLKQRIDQIGDDVSLLLTQTARNEGLRHLSPLYFEEASPTPETSW